MEHFFFGDDSRKLFGVFSPPSGKVRAGLVLCPPFGEEMIATYARFARWSKGLADQGFAVLRYHPYGTGESDGTSADFTFSGAAQDAANAVEWLRKHSGAEQIGIFGLRVGAAAAVCAPATADCLILWSPVLNLPLYFRDLLRLRVAKDMVQLKTNQVKVTAKDLTSRLESGHPIDVLGYEISPKLYRELTAFSAWPDSLPASRVLCLGLPSEQRAIEGAAKSWSERGCSVRTQTYRAPVFWEDFSSDFPHDFAQSSITWMDEQLAGPPGAG